MPRPLVFLMILSAVAPSGEGASRRFWVSLGAAAGAAVSDILSSRGAPEMNPLARGPHGRFSLSRGIVLKAAVLGGFYLLERKAPPAGEAANWVAAGVWAGAAIHNFTAPGPRRRPFGEPGRRPSPSPTEPGSP